MTGMALFGETGCLAAAALLLPHPVPGSPLAQAWHHTGAFWMQTGLVIAHHPLAILLCAAVPAAERGYILVRGPWMRGARIALLELLVTLWRVLLCVVAVWAACSGQEMHTLAARIGSVAAWQVQLGQMGANLAHHLRMVLWELLFFVAGMLLLYLFLMAIVRLFASGSAWLEKEQNRQAFLSILRNLILAPVLLIYLVEIARPTFQ